MTTMAQYFEEEGLQKGRQEGLQKGRQEEGILIAKNMLMKGLEVSLITELTGLSSDFLEKLQKEIRRVS